MPLTDPPEIILIHLAVTDIIFIILIIYIVSTGTAPIIHIHPSQNEVLYVDAMTTAVLFTATTSKRAAVFSGGYTRSRN